MLDLKIKNSENLSIFHKFWFFQTIWNMIRNLLNLFKEHFILPPHILSVNFNCFREEEKFDLEKLLKPEDDDMENISTKR